MILTLSPAKMLDFTSDVSTKKTSQLLFEENSVEINDILRDLDVNEISSLMKVNPKQALEVYQYIQAFDMRRTSRKQAAAAYNGMAYLGLDAATFTSKDWDFAQDHLVILSALYGALRPLDMIKPYRLEMQAKLANSKGKDLYEYWGRDLTEYLNDRLSTDDNVWLNLSSNEYSKVINKNHLCKGVKIITPVFKEQSLQGYKQVTVYAKKARGMMARFVIQKRIKNIEGIKLFDSEGYSFSPNLSDEKEWVFVR
ncbi:peroxide stress protein YaaA [Dysgonomonas macrotermitis]|uniref:UPF0246 protein SAMN05444362_101499 n=1 Tax=Dysgonomonas macrotermitis TaxID=1346286 RepID=A0A1M4U485_9BACT|nr:peroxide stress protein YaaA [Dysgonomonas macrotermitis]SHE51454.1 hypothetical protein SAMN05444362_101499 [Dysgonomonas macrotermitis]